MTEDRDMSDDDMSIPTVTSGIDDDPAKAIRRNAQILIIDDEQTSQMILSKFFTIAVWLVQWSILLHFIAVGLIFAGLLIHIYMAAIAPEERPAFWSMFNGSVPEEYAKHHHALWYNTTKPELKN